MTKPIDTSSPRVAYEQSTHADSNWGSRITGDEYAAIRSAFDRRTGVNILGYQLHDSTERTRRDFLTSLVSNNPALAQSLLRGENWDQYLSRRIRQDGRPPEAEEARAELRSMLGLTPVVNIPDALRREVIALGNRARAATDEITPHDDPKRLQNWQSIINHEINNATDLRRRIAEVPGVTDARATMFAIISASRR